MLVVVAHCSKRRWLTVVLALSLIPACETRDACEQAFEDYSAKFDKCGKEPPELPDDEACNLDERYYECVSQCLEDAPCAALEVMTPEYNALLSCISICSEE